MYFDRLQDVIVKLKVVLFLVKMIYIQVRFAIGNVFGEKIQNFYNSYPVILLYLIANANIGKLTQLLDNNDQVDLHVRYVWWLSQRMSPLMLAIQKRDMKILCILISYDEGVMEATVHQMKNTCIDCNRDERRAVTLCQQLVRNKYGNNLQVAILKKLQRCLDCQQLFIQTLVAQEKEFFTSTDLPNLKNLRSMMITKFGKRTKESHLLSNVKVSGKQTVHEK